MSGQKEVLVSLELFLKNGKKNWHTLFVCLFYFQGCIPKNGADILWLFACYYKLTGKRDKMIVPHADCE